MIWASLTFVGITLIMNGVSRLNKTDAKSTAFMNIITGAILVIGNLILLAQASTLDDYLNFTAGMLFGVTYLFIAACHILKIDWRCFGWYSLFVGIIATIMVIQSLLNGAWVMAFLWTTWAILWLSSFMETVLKIKKLEKATPIICITVGAIGALTPAILSLIFQLPL